MNLPGDIPGLLCRCSPVILIKDSGAGTCALHAGQRGVVLTLTSDDLGPVVALDDGRTLPIPCDQLALELSDRTGRLHAIAWIVRHPMPLLHTNKWSDMVRDTFDVALSQERLVAEVLALAGRLA